MSNAIRLLKKDHSNVKKLFRRFEKTDLSDGGTRADLFRQIHEELMLHTQVEEEILYPALEGIGTQESILYHEEAQQDHEGVKALLDVMSNFDPSDELFARHMGQVIYEVEYHIREEEEGIFPLLKKYLPSMELKAMGEAMEERKSALA